jgi:hypothetical protein
MRLLCSECSHGTPDDGHHHVPASSDATQLGLAGAESQLRPVLDTWRDSRPAVDLELTLLW